MKFPNFTFEEGRKQTTTYFYFLCFNLESGSKNPTAGEFLFPWLFIGNICVAFDNV